MMCDIISNNHDVYPRRRDDRAVAARLGVAISADIADEAADQVVASPQGEISNQLLETLEDWNAYLTNCDCDRIWL
jgi:type III secretion system FlhB-like substrate exporter